MNKTAPERFDQYLRPPCLFQRGIADTCVESVFIPMSIAHACLLSCATPIPTHPWHAPCTPQALLQHVGEVELGRFRSRRQSIETELPVYGTFRLNFYCFHRFELDLCGHTQP